MAMFNPPHPGEFISGVYLEPYSVNVESLAQGAKWSESRDGFTVI
jgi:plasmid maintenance system antidote protein VapI